MALTRYRIPPGKLRWHCPPEQFRFQCTDEINPLQDFIGQERAIKAIEFGLAIERPGYHLFLTGLTGTGKASAIKAYLQKTIARKQAQGAKYQILDWCYVNNFADPDRPKIIKLPQGQGKPFSQEVEGLLKTLKEEIPKAFASEGYERQRKEILGAGQSQQQKLFLELDNNARQQGFTIQLSPMGPLVVPFLEGKPMEPSQYMALKEEQRQALEDRRAEVMKLVQEAVEKAHTIGHQAEEQIKAIERQVGEFAVGSPLSRLIKQYQGLPEVASFLEELKSYTLANLDIFRAKEAPEQPQPFSFRQRDPFLPFQVNVFVDNSSTQGPPIIVEANPNWGNLFGKIERRAMMGTYFSDHTMLKPGAVQLANQGYLVLNIREVLLNPGVWEGLKRIIHTKEVRPEDPWEQFGLLAPQGLRPQPMPVEFKMVVMGEETLYRLLSLYDEDFWEMFKVKADFDFQVPRSPENMDAYAGFICSCCASEGLLPFGRSGVAKVMEQAARMVGDQTKLSARFGQLKDLLIEADHWARQAAGPWVEAEHVQKAVEEKVYRLNLVAERIRELIAEGTLMVDVSGEVVGQVNGLSVYDLGDFSFGRPSRITAKTFTGRRGVINIERESQLSGRIHDKGVLILSGYLGWKYAQDKPLSLSASLCFEQSYEGIEGDSASSTELYAVLSSLSGLPLKQGVAITGSVNQKGEIQPIGGVNQKIEGFFDVCKAKGLAREQGVIIPQQNVKNLMLREDVVKAVKQGKFHIYQVSTIDEGIEILTGVPAGERGQDGSYPSGTVNYLADKRLRELAQGLRGYYAEILEGN